MNKSKLLITSSVVVLLAFVAVGGWVWYKRYLDSPRQPTTRVAHFKPIPPQYTIQSEAKGNEIEVKNVEEGVSLLAPKNWSFATGPAKEKDSLILSVGMVVGSYNGDTTDEQDIQDEIDVTLFKFDNEKNFLLDEFVNQPGEDERLSRLGIKDNFQKTIWKSRPAYYSTRKDIEPNFIGPGDAGIVEPYFIVNNSLVISYFIPANNSKAVFMFICTARGVNFQTHIKECRTLLNEKLVLP